jgi:hypothetical protein
MIATSDECEPSWPEPYLELKDFQLGSARLVIFPNQTLPRYHLKDLSLHRLAIGFTGSY